jgi:hypothetical protein
MHASAISGTFLETVSQCRGLSSTLCEAYQLEFVSCFEHSPSEALKIKMNATTTQGSIKLLVAWPCSKAFKRLPFSEY